MLWALIGTTGILTTTRLSAGCSIDSVSCPVHGAYPRRTSYTTAEYIFVSGDN